MISTTIHRRLWWSVLTMIVLTAGCGSKVWVIRYPEFYDDKIKTVAVIGFENRTDFEGAGDIVAATLADGLRTNGAYDIISPDELRRRLDDAGVTLATNEEDASIAGKLRKLGGIDAFIRGSVPIYSATTKHYGPSASAHGFGPSAKYGFSMGLGDRFYAWYLYSASVAANVKMVRVRGAQVMYQTPRPFYQTATSEGDLPPTPYMGIRVRATGRLVDRLVDQIAPVQMLVKADHPLRTADTMQDDTYGFTDDFYADDKTLYVVLAMPPEADRNTFHVSITRKGRITELAGADIEWSRQTPVKHLEFDLNELAEKGGGSGDYEVKVATTNLKPLVTDFEIELSDGN